MYDNSLISFLKDHRTTFHRDYTVLYPTNSVSVFRFLCTLTVAVFLMWLLVACLSSLERPRWCRGREPACWCRKCKRLGSDPCAGKMPWRREWEPTLVFLPGRFHEQKSLVARGHEESDSWATARTGVSSAEKCLFKPFALFLAVPQGLKHLISLTGGWTWAQVLGSERLEFWPLDCQGVPTFVHF